MTRLNESGEGSINSVAVSETESGGYRAFSESSPIPSTRFARVR